MSEDIGKALRNRFRSLLPEGQRIGTVNSVDRDKKTCEVTIDRDEIILYDVLLSPDDSDMGILLIPKTGSNVVVSTMFDDDTQNYVTMTGEVDQVIIRGGSLGGLIRINDLVEKVNAIEDDINSLKQVFSTWSPVAQDGGAALKGASGSWSSNTITLTKVKDIENDKVTHG